MLDVSFFTSYSHCDLKGAFFETESTLSSRIWSKLLLVCFVSLLTETGLLLNINGMTSLMSLNSCVLNIRNIINVALSGNNIVATLLKNFSTSSPKYRPIHNPLGVKSPYTSPTTYGRYQATLGSFSAIHKIWR